VKTPTNGFADRLGLGGGAKPRTTAPGGRPEDYAGSPRETTVRLYHQRAESFCMRRPSLSTAMRHLPSRTRLLGDLATQPHRWGWPALIFFATFVALTSVFEGDAPLWTAFDNLGELLAAALATAACAIRARRERSLYASLLELQRNSSSAATFEVELQRQTRTAWSLLTLGVGAWAAGQAGWTIYEVGLHITPPTPSVLDGLFLSSAILIVAGLLAMVRTPAGHLSHLRGAGEALFLAGGCALLSWSLIGPTILASKASALEQAINLAYPALDAMALAAVLFVALRRVGDPLAGLGLLGLGIVCVAISDSAFWYLSNIDGGVPGATPLDAGWVAGFLLVALAALRERTRRRRGRLARSRATLALPALPTAIGILVVALTWLENGNLQSSEALVGILSVVVMLGVWLVLVISYENHSLVNVLERRVEQRTADRTALQDRLRHDAFHDPLTGVANRMLLAEQVTKAFARSQRTVGLVAVMAIDLDGFKMVNDRLGHDTGDELLRSVAKRLQATVRPQDTVARSGGDEFVVLLEAVERPEDALALAERIHEAMQAPVELGGEQHTITVSIGVAVDSPPHSNFEQLLSDADVAMYAVKSGGRDAVQLFQSSMHKQARERFQTQTELREGLERGEFWLLYQPEFDCAGERLEGFEALMRWNSPKRGLIAPDRFIPLAEDTGLIVPLGRWALNEALRLAATWDPVGEDMRAPTISVNVSAVQLNSPSFVADVQDALSQSGIEPARVVLEITESSLIDSSPRVVDVLHALKRLGVRIAIDDFGTGYASISYLQNIPVDILKVDKSFVVGSEDGKRGRELLEAIVNIGRVLSLVTIAEGVEQPSQLETVKQSGCDLVQGYIFSRPLPHEETQRLIDEHSAGRTGAGTQLLGVA
jgi:diguanylate cyclase